MSSTVSRSAAVRGIVESGHRSVEGDPMTRRSALAGKAAPVSDAVQDGRMVSRPLPDAGDRRLDHS